jgi:photosystem II stability/assembly factor-like uncharacterized protein
LAVDPRNANTLYASISGPNQTGQAIYRSTDGGRAWSPVNTSIPVVGSLVVSPENSSTVYAATYSGGVFKSTDGGANWTESNTGLRTLGIQVLVVDPVEAATVYAGSDEGLFKSIDGGTSWNKHAAFEVAAGAPPPGLPPPAIPIPGAARAGVRSLLIDFTNPDILYVAAQRIDGCFFTDINLFKSTDGGATWNDSITPKQSGCLADRLLAMDPTAPQTIYLRYGFILDSFGLLKSTDGGATWDFTTLDANALNVLAIDPTSPATLYVGTDSGVLRSIDGGATWNLIGLAKANVNLLVIDPTQPNVLYAGTSGVYPDGPGLKGLFRSTDSGATWLSINDGLGTILDTHTDVNALIVDPDNTATLYAGTAGYGVFKSADGGASWASYNNGLTYLDVRALAIARGTSTTVYAGTTGGIFKMVEDGNQAGRQ